MSIAILSDIHSNRYALDAVLADLRTRGITKLLVLGDTFGYYPWAVETYDLLAPYRAQSLFLKGNHDELLLTDQPPVPQPSYWEAALQNARDLRAQRPEAMQWLAGLSYEMTTDIGGMQFRMQHGTPDDKAVGRFYPDNTASFDWFPKKGEALLMGHTHYPILREVPGGGWLFNPGSVGQPRDGNPASSWGLYDEQTQRFSLQRTPYDQHSAMRALEAMGWEERAIRALNKTAKGAL